MEKLDEKTLNRIIEDLKRIRDNGVLTMSISDLIQVMEFKYKANNIESKEGSDNDAELFSDYDDRF